MDFTRGILCIPNPSSTFIVFNVTMVITLIHSFSTNVITIITIYSSNVATVEYKQIL